MYPLRTLICFDFCALSLSHHLLLSRTDFNPDIIFAVSLCTQTHFISCMEHRVYFLFCILTMCQLISQHLLTDDIPLWNSLDKITEIFLQILLSYRDIFAKVLTHLLKCKLTCSLISMIDKP